MRNAIVVLGMHRSGTSSLTGILNLSGLSIGKSEMLGNETNPKGFFENYRLMMFNESLLSSLNYTWNSPIGIQNEDWNHNKIRELQVDLKAILSEEFPGSDPILIKDPRMCILLPVWLETFREMNIAPSFVFCSRSPEGVALSLSARDHFSVEKSNFLWMFYTLLAELHSRNYPRIFVDYTDILADPVNVIKTVFASILPEHQPIIANTQTILEFVDPGLNHEVNSQGYDQRDRDSAQMHIYEMLRTFRFRNTTPSEENNLDLFHNRFLWDHIPRLIPRITVRIIVEEGSDGLTATLNSIFHHPYLNLLCELVVNGRDPEIYRIIDKYSYLGLKVTETTANPINSRPEGLIQPSEERFLFLRPGELLDIT